MSRRKVLGLVGAALGLTACGATEKVDADGVTRLWYWPGGLSPVVLTEAAQQFADRTALEPALIEGDYRAQLVDLLARGGDLPSIVGIKGEDMASLLPRADLFADLHTLGADEVSADYLSWKWQQASAPDNRLIGFPIDIGPTAMFYRSDLFARAGLPGEPAAVAAAIRTWDDLFDAGAQLRSKLPAVHLIRNAAELFTVMIYQGAQRYVDETNHFIGDESHIRQAWDVAAQVVTRKLGAGIPKADEDGWKKGLADGTVAAVLGAVWLGFDLKSSAPDTTGRWRVAAGPATGANYGGSFLAIPQAAAGHELAFEIIKWLLAPDNLAQAFTDAALFPAAPSTYDMPALVGADPFFGGQQTVGIFAESARQARRGYEAPADADIHGAFVVQLDAYESGLKSAGDAWRDAVVRGRAIAVSMGVD
ncbi:MAG: ABC transporter substrate-binding protein [Actinoplanes sp.]